MNVLELLSNFIKLHKTVKLFKTGTERKKDRQLNYGQ